MASAEFVIEAAARAGLRPRHWASLM